MKLKITKKIAASFLLVLGLSGAAFAQNEERTYQLEPNKLTPAQDGYFVAGRTLDNGTFHNGCGVNDISTEHNAASHNESGSYGGFTYANVSVMPNCLGKGTPEPGFPNPRGYVQLREFANFSTYETSPKDPSLVYGSITSMAVTNIKSLVVMAGADVSLNDNRSVVFGIEASEDNGETWDIYATQILSQQGGVSYTFTAGGDVQGFNSLATLSTQKPVMIRIIPWRGGRRDDVAGNRGQRLKVHGLSLTATGPVVTSSKEELAKNEPFFEIEKNSFIAKKEALKVYNMVGGLVGSGKNVTVPGSGLYIVRSENGLSRKVFLQ